MNNHHSLLGAYALSQSCCKGYDSYCGQWTSVLCGFVYIFSGKHGIWHLMAVHLHVYKKTKLHQGS